MTISRNILRQLNGKLHFFHSFLQMTHVHLCFRTYRNIKEWNIQLKYEAFDGVSFEINVTKTQNVQTASKKMLR